MLHQHAPLGAVRVSCPVVFPCVGVYERTQCFPSLATRVVATVPVFRGAQRVLRYGDMEYVMLHLIFIYLMPGEGQPAAYAASDL